MQSERSQKTGYRAAWKSRRHEVEHCLAVSGLLKGPRRVAPGLDDPVAAMDHSRRLRAALEDLGPVFGSFGLYLSSRVDLLPAKDRLELSHIPDQAPATPAPVVRSLFMRDFGNSQDSIFSTFDETPFESRLLFQLHRAKLQNGGEVIVKIVHPQVDQYLQDADLVFLLKEALANGKGSAATIDAAILDFRHGLHQRMDLVHEASALESLAEDANELEALRAPLLYRHLSSSQVLTVQELRGMDLTAFTADSPPDPDLARMLCMVWLRQALLGQTYPVEPGIENIVVLPGNRIVFRSAPFATLPKDSKANLWDYLIAVANEDPDRACSCLLREMKNARHASDEELHRRFRQIVPFRDGSWTPEDRAWRDKVDDTALAENLFIQWTLASGRGYVPEGHLPSFYRGLFKVIGVARRLAPNRDCLSEALRDLRIMSGFDQIKELMVPKQFTGLMEKYATSFAEMPQKMDAFLTDAAAGDVKVRVHTPRSAERRQRENSSTFAISLLLVLAAIALLWRHFGVSAVSGQTGNAIGALAFVVLGAILLRVVSRMG